MDSNTLVIIPNETKPSLKVAVVENLHVELITVLQSSVICALSNCNQPTMTALLEYSGSLALYLV